MKKNINLSYYKIVPFLVLAFPIFIDCLTGILRGRTGQEESFVGTIYRGMVILYSLKFLFRFRYTIYFLCVIFISVLSLFYSVITGIFHFSDISALSKILFMYPVLAILLDSRYCSNANKVIDYSIYYGLGAAIVLIYCFVFNVGYASYIEGGFGTKGIFVAMNDVGLTILLVNVLSCYMFMSTKKKRYLVYTSIMLFGSALIGSMAGFLGSAIILLCLVVAVVFIRFNDCKMSKKTKTFILTFIISILIFAFGKIVQIIIEDPYLSTKYADVYETVSEVSGRGILIESANKVLRHYGILDFLFGKASYFYDQIAHYMGMNEPKAVEVDFYDLYGTYGIIFTLLIFGFICMFFVKSVYLFLKYRMLLPFWLLIGFVIYIGHSFYGGHAFTSPMVSTYIAVYIYLYVIRRDLVHSHNLGI